MRHCCGRCWRGTDERRWSRHEAGPRVLVLAIRRGRGLCAVGVVYSVTVKELTHAVHEILSDAMENQLKGNTAADMTIAVFTMALAYLGVLVEHGGMSAQVVTQLHGVITDEFMRILGPQAQRMTALGPAATKPPTPGSLN